MAQTMGFFDGPSSGMGASSFETPKVRVELSVSAQSLKDRDGISVSDPLCIFYMKEKNGNAFTELGRTERIENTLDPQWVKKFEVDYRFEERQLLKFAIYDWDTKSTATKEQDFLGECECSLGEIMAVQGSQLKKPLKNKCGTFFVCGEEISGPNEILSMEFAAKDLDKKDFFGKSDPFLVLSRCLQDDSFSAVYKTDVIENNLNPHWKKMSMPLRRLCGGDEDKPIKIECFDWDSDGSHDLIGQCMTNMRTLRQGPGTANTYTLINPKKQKKSSYKGSGSVSLVWINIRVEPSFLDHIKNGLQIHFTVAVDFTASNGDPRTPNSLHYCQAGVDNQYSLGIKAVGEIIQDYDSDKMFPALGFGAKFPDGTVSHEFFLNLSPDSPYCQGIPGVLDAYQRSLHHVRLYGPTYFAPVIRHVMKFASAYGNGVNYFILLILTDGIITDLDETKKVLIEASRLPISVIIVGVGAEDFSKMEILDGDNKKLSYQGLFAERDIVQFVELRQFLSSNHLASREALAAAVLKEVPQQVSSYMRLHPKV